VGDDVPTARIRVTPHLVQRTRADSAPPGVALTRPGIVLGSAPYMSPEQWAFPHAVGVATDIYSLGCVAYEALSGQVPFSGPSTAQYYQQHLRAAPPALGNLPPALDGVLRRALAKSPEARHGSALELASELWTGRRTRSSSRCRTGARSITSRTAGRGAGSSRSRRRS
jgi:serine/threonine protein kinase